jgi:hypothetical protein
MLHTSGWCGVEISEGYWFIEAVERMDPAVDGFAEVLVEPAYDGVLTFGRTSTIVLQVVNIIGGSSSAAERKIKNSW